MYRKVALRKRVQLQGIFMCFLHLKLPCITGRHFPNEFNHHYCCHCVGLLFAFMLTTAQLLECGICAE